MKIETNAAAHYAALNSAPATSESSEIPFQQVLQEDTVSLSGVNGDEQYSTEGHGFGRVPPP